MFNKNFNGDNGLANLLKSEIVNDFNSGNLKVYKCGSISGNIATYRVVDFFPATAANKLRRDSAQVSYYCDYEKAMSVAKNYAYVKQCGGFSVLYEKSGRSWNPIQVIA